MKIEVTPAQIFAIINLKEDCKAMCSGGDDEPAEIWKKHIQHIEKMLKNNQIKE